MADPLEELLSERVRDIRTRLGLPQSEVAARMSALGSEVKVPALSMVESGRRRLTVPELATLLLALGGTPTAAVEVRAALLNLAGVDDRHLRDQLAALGGADLGGPGPLGGVGDLPAQVQVDADRIARDRQRERLIEKIALVIPWRELGLGNRDRAADMYGDRGGLDPHDRDLILDHLEDLFGNRDPLEVREQLVEDAVALDRVHGGPVGAEASAQQRGWATRRLIEMVVEELQRGD